MDKQPISFKYQLSQKEKNICDSSYLEILFIYLVSIIDYIIHFFTFNR